MVKEIAFTRSHCCLCKSSLMPFYSQKNFPFLSNPTLQPIEEDIFCNIDFGICSICRSVQLISLVDPAILYSSDNKSSLTPLWKEHHTSFAEFIKTFNTEKTICEIGGGSNPFDTYINNIESYTILDIYEPFDKKEGINYLLGNCESFTEYIDNSVLLSHTFEHLYNPREFVSSLEKSKVNHIYISVPNMRKWLENKLSTYLIFNQHTFYFEDRDIIALFSQYSFSCKETLNFKDHSLFFYFVRDNSVSQLPIPIKDNEIALYEHFKLKETILSNIYSDKNIFIMPSFYIGQIAHFYLNKSINIVGFLDNDINKHGKRLYGTDLNIFHPSEILNYDQDKITVFIISSPYLNEMVYQLRSLSPTLDLLSIVF